MASIWTEFIIKQERRPCFVDDKKATFHQWIEKETPILKLSGRMTYENACEIRRMFDRDHIINDKFDFQVIRETLGLVEYEDGTMAEVEPTSIRFDVELEKEQTEV